MLIPGATFIVFAKCSKGCLRLFNGLPTSIPEFRVPWTETSLNFVPLK